MTGPKLLIVGCGYVGSRLAAQALQEGRSVSAIVRSPARCEALREEGICATTLDLDSRLENALDTAARVICYLVPPPSDGREDPRLSRFLGAIAENALPERVILIGTTGVYGDAGGAWVDEDSPIDPSTDRARRRRGAEIALIGWAEARDIPWIILRVPGIYGPGRLPLERIRARTPVLDEAESPWSNRIHVDDLVGACMAAADTHAVNQVFNVSDGCPTTMTDYFNRVADHFGLSRPPQIPMASARARLGEGILSYLAESRRISNARMRDRLGVTPRYPDLESGLAEIDEGINK
ncbi:MAG: NAD(P)H-binding protein [Gammaproteobacteria bacterium]|nr:NAD(P)H-binding protein [Gammaproteobacteria bacterium]